jgi:hypothetical protein
MVEGMGGGGRQAGQGSGIAGWACGFEREVLLIVWSLNVWSAEKPRQNILGTRGGLYVLSSLFIKYEVRSNERYDIEFIRF